MTLRKYGTADDQQVTEVETTREERDAMIAKAAVETWTEEDWQTLYDENRE